MEANGCLDVDCKDRPRWQDFALGGDFRRFSTAFAFVTVTVVVVRVRFVMRSIVVGRARAMEG